MDSTWCARSKPSHSSHLKQGIRQWLSCMAPAVIGLVMLMGSAVHSQTLKSVATAAGQYHLYIDADANPGTGCQANFTDARG